MPSWFSDIVVAALLTGVLGIIAGRMSSVASVRAAAVQAVERERELVAAPYRELAARVAALEREAAELQRQLNTMRGRERQWQFGWDELRRHWPDVRQRVEPPPYPAERNEV